LPGLIFPALARECRNHHKVAERPLFALFKKLYAASCGLVAAGSALRLFAISFIAELAVIDNNSEFAHAGWTPFDNVSNLQ
jgi:hypothetical protein